MFVCNKYFLLFQGSKALEDFIESIRNDSSSGLPKDGTVHELTSNVLVFLEQLLDYSDMIARVLSQDAAYSSALAMLPNANKIDKNKALLGIYISTLVQLFTFYHSFIAII